MYSSLDKIDIVVKGEPPEYVQTDHRSRAEIEAEPEISVLFALTRMRSAAAHGASQGIAPTLVYMAAADEVPAFLHDAIGAAGGVIERPDRARITPTTTATTAELADRAFRALADRVQRRLGTAEPEASLRALEAQLIGDRPQREADEPAYWTAVCELIALTGECLRARHGGSWVESTHAELPFGFSLGSDRTVVPSNRAQRFLADGADESMLQLLASGVELAVPLDGPVLPSLRARAEAVDADLVFRPLFDSKESFSELPVIAYGRDTPTSFALTRARSGERADDLHAEALGNLAAQEVTVERVEGLDFEVLAVTGSFYATEKLLDVAFMRALQQGLGQPMLTVTVPRRGLMLVTGISNDPKHLALLTAMTRSESGTTRSISEALLLVQDGEIAGLARVATEPPPKKLSWFRRMFRRD